MLNIEQQVVKQIVMNNINKILLAIIILLQNTVFAQVCECLKVTSIKDCYNAYNDCITFNVTNKCDSTIECIMLWGCTTTWIFSAGTSNSHLASMTSSPLFINVAESIVILDPIFHFGCFRACSGVTSLSCS